MKSKTCQDRGLNPGLQVDSPVSLPLYHPIWWEEFPIFVLYKNEISIQIVLFLNRNARNLANCEKKLRSTLKVEFFVLQKVFMAWNLYFWTWNGFLFSSRCWKYDSRDYFKARLRLAMKTTLESYFQHLEEKRNPFQHQKKNFIPKILFFTLKFYY